MKNLTGEVFARWTVIKENGRDKSRNILWLCRCECGNIKNVRAHSLRNNLSKSCGCLQKDVAKSQIVHGEARREGRSSEYTIWQGIIDRCNNPNCPKYANYGGRGIKVCDEWRSYSNFLNDMGSKPSFHYEIDRINNEKGYYKENCRWVTRQQNVHNAGSSPNSTSKYKGVCYDKSRGKWKAQLSKDGNFKLNKRFNTEREAAIAYNEAAKKHFKEFAYLNKIE